MMPSFKNTASIFPEISFIQYFPLFSCKLCDVITDLICIIEKCLSLKRKKIFQKEKRHSSVFGKAFQISTKKFSFHRHFKSASLTFKTVFGAAELLYLVILSNTLLYFSERSSVFKIVKCKNQ